MTIDEFNNLSDDEKKVATRNIQRAFVKHIAFQTLVPMAVVVATHLIVKKLENHDAPQAD